VVVGNSTGNATTTEYTTTEIVTSYTTYCPLPTVFVEGNKTYTVTKVCHASLYAVWNRVLTD
jgi:hypothetical protein